MGVLGGGSNFGDGGRERGGRAGGAARGGWASGREGARETEEGEGGGEGVSFFSQRPFSAFICIPLPSVTGWERRRTARGLGGGGLWCARPPLPTLLHPSPTLRQRLRDQRRNKESHHHSSPASSGRRCKARRSQGNSMAVGGWGGGFCISLQKWGFFYIYKDKYM